MQKVLRSQQYQDWDKSANDLNQDMDYKSGPKTSCLGKGSKKNDFFSSLLLLGGGGGVGGDVKNY